MSLSRLASQEVQRAAAPIPIAAAVAQPNQDDRFDLLTKYVPTETLTLYVAAMSAIASIHHVFSPVGPWQVYIAGAVLTPVILLLATYGKQRAAGLAASFKPHPWPIAASLIAYLVWALSVPGLLEDGDQKILAGIGALLVATVLGLLDTVFAPIPAAGGGGDVQPDPENPA